MRQKTYSGRYFWNVIRWKAFDLNGNYQHFNNKDDAIKFSQSGIPLREYRGFHYSRPGLAFKDGVHIFTNIVFDSFEEFTYAVDGSLRMKELSRYNADRYNDGGNFPDEAEEDEAAERDSRWIGLQHSLQMNYDERH